MKQALAAHPRFDVRGSSSDVGTALAELRLGASPLDIVLLDFAVPEGRDGARLLRAALPQVRLVALGLSEDARDVIGWAEAGASGLVSDSASLAELIDTLLGVARGEAPCSPRIAAALLRRVSATAGQTAPARTNGTLLTDRERDVAWLLNEGMSNKEIARRLQIELGTVKNHVHNVLRKLGVNGRGEAAAALRRDAGMDRRAQAPAAEV